MKYSKAVVFKLFHDHPPQRPANPLQPVGPGGDTAALLSLSEALELQYAWAL